MSLFKDYFIANKNILILSIFFHVAAAFFTIGHHNPDEHWQILEFAAYKLEMVEDVSKMPWEFHTQSRQTIQPFIVYIFSKVLLYLNIFSPFVVTLLLRIISCILGWYSANLLNLYASKFFPDKSQFQWLVILTNFLWFVPYVHARFQGENWSGIFLVFGIFVTLNAYEKNRNFIHFIWAGLLLGFSFNCRFQIGFALLFLGLWLLIFQKFNIKAILGLAAGFICMLGIEVLVDYWYYGNIIFMPYKYFHIQFVEGVANGWGIFPWWYYGYLFLTQGAMPLSLVLVIMLGISTIKYPKNIFIWIVWGFVLGHNLNGYKEIRFLYPIIPFLIIASLLSLNTLFIVQLIQKLNRKFLNIFFSILLIENSVLLIAATFKPANESVSFFQSVYHYSDKNIRLYTTEKNPYLWGQIAFNFYKPKNLSIVKFDSETFKNDHSDAQNQVFLFNDGFAKQKEFETLNLTLVTKTVPDWLKNFNIGNWLSRARVWSLYELREPPFVKE